MLVYDVMNMWCDSSKEQMYQLKIHKPMGPDGIHLRVLKE